MSTTSNADTHAIARTPYDEVPRALLDELAAAGLDPRRVYAGVADAVAEDLPDADVTSWSTIPADRVETADFVAREPGTVAGLLVSELVFRHVLGDVAVRRVAEGSAVAPGDTVLTVTGRTALLLTAERTALNYAGHLSGIATATAAWAQALAGTGARVRDTRKTLPGWRDLAKYAVRCGGGLNHRHSLSDAALVKDNHVAAAGGVAAAYRLVRERFPEVPVQVEVDDLDQLREALDAGADEVLLDNFTPAQLRQAVATTAGRARLEASGGLDLTDAEAYGATGVDYLAVGGLTHSARVLDIGMDLREVR